MEQSENIMGIQHLGLPTRDMAATLRFYKGLGFEVALQTRNDGAAVNFFRLKNLTIEAYESPDAVQMPGAIDHIALEVADIDDAFAMAKQSGFDLLDQEVQFLPFWENGVKFFTILGPNAEKIEFSQKL
ncbi:MAG: VOC family protein [Ruthenibacterium sp.]